MCMENTGNGLWIGPKTWDRNCRNSLETLWAVRDSPEFQWVWVGLTCVLNGCLVCIGNSKRGFHYSRNNVLKIYFRENICLVK